MSSTHRCLFVIAFVGLLTPHATAQLGGMGGGMSAGGGGFAPGTFPAVAPAESLPVNTEPATRTAELSTEMLDENVEFGQIDTVLRELENVLTEITGLAFFLDERAIAKANLSLDQSIQVVVPELPLRSAIRRILQPLGLKVVVQDEGLAITADFSELARRGIETDAWVDRRNRPNAALLKALDQKVEVKFQQTPLDEAIATLSDQMGISMVIDRRALEEIGITPDTPVLLSLQSVSARSVLRLMLQQLDLTYVVKDEVMQITTLEAAEYNLVSRIYFLEATGLPIGDFDYSIHVIQSNVVPDTWEQLGGPSTMATLMRGRGNRPSLLVSTTLDVHEQISDLLQTLREIHFGPDPVVEVSGTKPASQPKRTGPEHVGGQF